MSDPERARSFDRVAGDYDRYRPGYPAALFDELASRAALEPRAALLEIGAGTGRATLPFLERGFAVQAIEPGAELAALLRAKAPGLVVHEGRFEDVRLRPGTFALVYAAQSYHWLDPATRLERIAALLRPGGHLAVFGNSPRRPAGALEDEMQRAYARDGPADSSGGGVPHWYAPGRGPFRAEAAASTHFGDITECVHLHEVRYSRADYLGLLRTHSDHQVLPVATLEALLADIGTAIERHGGEVPVHYTCSAVLVRRVG